jgi:hypothetical protein
LARPNKPTNTEDQKKKSKTPLLVAGGLFAAVVANWWEAIVGWF